MGLSNYCVSAILNSFFGKTSDFGALATRPTIYVGLSSTAPTASGSNVTEPSGNNYARVATAAGDWTASTSGTGNAVSNGNAVEFPSPSGSWSSGSNMTHAVFYDASTSGNFLGSTALTTPKAFTTGDTARFPAASITADINF
jgi:hypothetical protein